MQRWSMAVLAAVLLGGCAQPGGAPSPPISVTVVASASVEVRTMPARPVPGPASAVALPPPRRGEASCARGATPMPSLPPSFDLNDPRQRALHALTQQHEPTPRRGTVPEAAVPGAEACIYLLRMNFSLLTAGSPSPPGTAPVEAALRSAGLMRIVVRPGPVFAASTGAACLSGRFTTDGPAFTIGPPAATCRP
jgi:hypothetical protein